MVHGFRVAGSVLCVQSASLWIESVTVVVYEGYEGASEDLEVKRFDKFNVP